MASLDSTTLSTRNGVAQPIRFRFLRERDAPKRNAPYDEEPGYYAPGHLWLYGNVKLLHGRLAYVPRVAGEDCHTRVALDAIEQETEKLVLDGRILVCGIHNPAHQRAAVVPLRWGAPRIVVLSGGFRHHLGSDLKQEPFRGARLWRYEWDPMTDLAIAHPQPSRH